MTVPTRRASTHPPEPPPEAGQATEPGYRPDPEDLPPDQPAATLDADEELDREMADSFPASDPPSSWAGPEDPK